MVYRLLRRLVHAAILSSTWGICSLTKFSAFVDALVKILGINAPALINMKPSVVTQFGKRTRVNSDVKYFTWAGNCSIATVLFA